MSANRTITRKDLDRLAVPAIISGIAEPIISLSDTAFAGRLGAHDLAAVGIGTSFFLLVLWVLAQTRSAVLAITDTGVGIPADQLPYIFDGLHTTKERGMGLGLYTSRAIVERHVGRIKVQSKLGDGTTFTISLPVKETEVTV